MKITELQTCYPMWTQREKETVIELTREFAIEGDGTVDDAIAMLPDGAKMGQSLPLKQTGGSFIVQEIKVCGRKVTVKYTPISVYHHGS